MVMVNMTGTDNPDEQQAIKELSQYPKIEKVQVVGPGKDTLLVETADVYLYTTDRKKRSKLGKFLFILNPDDILIKNADALPSATKSYTYSNGYKQQGNFESSSNNLHHPHISGNYVSLAAHETPLVKAVKEKDWVQATNICLKFLEDYKFGEKARRFFERQTEIKGANGWEEVDYSIDLFEIGDFQGSSTYRPGSTQSDAVREIKRKLPIGTRIKLTGGGTNTLNIGTEGTVEGFYMSSVKMDWDGCHYGSFSPNLDEYEVIKYPVEYDHESHVAEVERQEKEAHGPYSLNPSYTNVTTSTATKVREAKRAAPVGSVIRITKSTMHGIAEGMEGTITSWDHYGPTVKFSEQNYPKILSCSVDKWDIVETPELPQPGDRIRVTKPALWRQMLKKDDVGRVTFVTEHDRVLQVEWEAVDDRQKNRLRNIRLEGDDEYVIISDEEEAYPSPRELAGEDSIDTGKSTSSQLDKADDEEELWGMPWYGF